MTVVGLDQSYSAFGYSSNGKALKKGFPATKFEHPGDRLDAIEEWLSTWLLTHDRIELVVREGYANAAKFGREAAGELGRSVDRTVHEVTGYWPLIVPPTTLKKFVTGKGNAKKNEMLLGVFKQWGVEFSDDNQADAYSLEMFGWAWLDFHEDPGKAERIHKKYQIEAIKALKSKTK